jgi:hypothetical protein
VVIRLNDDGTTPKDNPFYQVGENFPGEVGANIQRMFAFGVRNSFGLAFDPFSGHLWDQQNGDDSFDEINRVEPGRNGGWVQVMGPLSRIRQYKAIETSPQYFGLQQVRWSPRLIADTPQEALDHMWKLKGSTYTDPEFSWKYAVAPGGIGFLSSSALGDQYMGDLFVGAATTNLDGGYLFRFELNPDRMSFHFTDPKLFDQVADNPDKFTINESESLLFGTGFGIGTDIETGPNGNLYVVSLDQGAVYEIFKKSSRDVSNRSALVSAPALASPALHAGLSVPLTVTPPTDVSDAAPGGPDLAAADGTNGSAPAAASQRTTTPAGASFRAHTAGRGLTLLQEAHLVVAGFDG